ncbi:divalent cation transporter [Parahaliea maris]|uniref:Divalent cation transporter n=1 Tax=Parahaliea maris TaxID=2716870 RepID=A0A5C9A792_9GAMM|nr:divalent cation transporter [Parahaliea maris]TXS95447.1 divalent cation transporter [Parahaliea maris]
MTDLAYISLLTFAAGLCMPLGGAVARIERVRPRWLENEFRHFMIALGGGLLLGGVFEVLLPEGMARFDSQPLGVLVFALGGFAFFAIERTLGLRHRQNPQLMGMLLDYLPESLALGALAVSNPSTALLLALVIGAQNIPEGFNAYRELDKERSHRSRGILAFMLLLTPIGPIAAVAAHFLIRDEGVIIGSIMLMSAGGIMYIIFQDIAPQSRLKNHWAPPLGAILGFALTLQTSFWLQID